MPQERTGLRFGQGTADQSWSILVYSEQLFDYFDAYGLGASGTFFAPVTSGEDLRLGVPAQFTAALSAGSDYIAYETFLSAGLGVEFRGFRPSVGAALDFLFGNFPDLGPYGNFLGFNFGGYLGLDDSTDGFPVFATARAYTGNLSGLYLAGGVRF